ncbi:MAG: S8/S53 family peptidase [Bernardetiaceae bacterium]|jgi:subtilisin family serine protease|nr:S8/S53 family peptidase [Bernardetiaceae bacterium]
MKTTTTLAALALLAWGCQNRTPESSVEPTAPARTALDRPALDRHIWQTVKQQSQVFDWNQAPAQVVWSALITSDSVMAIGYAPAGLAPTELGRQMDQLNLVAPEWQAARQAVLDLVWASERAHRPELQQPAQLLAFPENELPVLNLKVSDLATVERLRASPLVRYAEPMGYEPTIDLDGGPSGGRVESSSGCGDYNEEFNLQPNVHFFSAVPNAKVSWNHAYHQVAGAWTKSSGAGIKVMVIDTGISPDQDNFGSQFNQGASAGRTIEKLVTLPRARFLGIPTGPVETPNDGCGHGTAMAGVLAAPLGTDGNAAGIAFNANLVTVRASQDVFLDASREVRGVADAYLLAANRPDIRIISLSLGRITSSSQIADAIRYAANRGKLMFCAGGTSFGWTAGWFGVIFPANMSEVQAVTGLKENGQRCEACHDGSQIDFALVMERDADGIKPITTAVNGNWPSTAGGSSVATAQAAGIAALVWARFPAYTRDQVLNQLVITSANFPNRSGQFGWGKLNADAATGGNDDAL